MKQPVILKGRVRELADIVYRGSFAYDPEADALTLWYSGARYESGNYVWRAGVERRLRTEAFSETKVVIDPTQLPPAPAPLTDWP